MGKNEADRRRCRLTVRAVISVILFAVLACGQSEEAGSIGVQNVSGRAGAYYIPSASQPTPLLVILHGSGGSGQEMVDALHDLAKTRHFAIIAPDSRQLPDGGFTWEVGDKQGDVTPDLTHTLDCIAWVRAHAHITVDESHVLIAGFSGGGSSAPYIASNRPGFTHAAILHGGVFPGGIGERRFPVWLSTGEEDRYRPPQLVQQAVASLTGLGFNSVTFRTYPGRHDLSDPELNDLIDWWLAP
jgi:predicted esterase